MSGFEKWVRAVRTRTVAFISIIIAVAITAVSCSGGGGGSTAAVSGIAPDLVADYVHTVMAADRTAYTKHVVNRSKKLEGKIKRMVSWRSKPLKDGNKPMGFPSRLKCSA